MNEEFLHKIIPDSRGAPYWQLAAQKDKLLRRRQEKLNELLTFSAGLPAARGLDLRAGLVDVKQGVIKIGASSELARDTQAELHQLLNAFVPWKKGPFSLFGEEIDSEWRSDLKWQRFLPYVGSLAGQDVCDIGCNNGYYMLRMLDLNPSSVLGVEPVVKHWLAFALLRYWAAAENLFFEPWGCEHLEFLPKAFDTVFCLGILYHHTDPVGQLRKIKTSLKPRGRLFVDCQAIPGDEPYALVPERRYAGASGVWFLPTKRCLTHWLRRAGFQNVEIIYDEPLSCQEQRATPWAPVKSLRDFLDRQNPSLTVEGYPAPRRVYALAY